MSAPAPAATSTASTRGTEPAALGARLRLAVARLSRRIRQQAAVVGEELTASSQGALATIERLGPLTLGELAAVEQVRPPSMTRIVARLEEDGYTTRAVDPDDRRVARAEITQRGRDLLARSRTRKDAYLAQRVALLSAEERAALARALPILERLLDDMP